MKGLSHGVMEVNNKLSMHVEQSMSNHRAMQRHMTKFQEDTATKMNNAAVLSSILEGCLDAKDRPAKLPDQ